MIVLEDIIAKEEIRQQLQPRLAAQKGIIAQLVQHMKFLAPQECTAQQLCLLLQKEIVIQDTIAQMVLQRKLLKLSQLMVVNNAHLATTALLDLQLQSCALLVHSISFMGLMTLVTVPLVQQVSTAKVQETLKLQQLAKLAGTVQPDQQQVATPLKSAQQVTSAQLVLLLKPHAQLTPTKKISDKFYVTLVLQDSNAH